MTVGVLFALQLGDLVLERVAGSKHRGREQRAAERAQLGVRRLAPSRRVARQQRRLLVDRHGYRERVDRAQRRRRQVK